MLLLQNCSFWENIMILPASLLVKQQNLHQEVPIVETLAIGFMEAKEHLQEAGFGKPHLFPVFLSFQL